MIAGCGSSSGMARFEGTVSGYWDVANIRDIIGTPTTQNGNAANFTIEQFEAGMAEFADGDYDADSGSVQLVQHHVPVPRAAGLHRKREHTRCACRAWKEVAAQVAAEGSCSTYSRSVRQRYADQAALEALATEELKAACRHRWAWPHWRVARRTTACGPELGDLLVTGGEATGEMRFGDCIANCISDQTGVSVGLHQLLWVDRGLFRRGSALRHVRGRPNDGSARMHRIARLENCIDVDACTGLCSWL